MLTPRRLHLQWLAGGGWRGRCHQLTMCGSGPTTRTSSFYSSLYHQLAVCFQEGATMRARSVSRQWSPSCSFDRVQSRPLAAERDKECNGKSISFTSGA